MTHVFFYFPVKREGMSLTNVLAGRPHVPDGLPFPFLHVRRSSAHSACQVSTDGRLLFSPDARMGRIGSTFREEVCSYWSNNLSPRKGLENYFHLTLEKSDVMSKSFVTRAESHSRPFSSIVLSHPVRWNFSHPEPPSGLEPESFDYESNALAD